MIKIAGKKHVFNNLWRKRLDKTIWMDYLPLVLLLNSFRALFLLPVVNFNLTATFSLVKNISRF